jgi:hypothetical protein
MIGVLALMAIYSGTSSTETAPLPGVPSFEGKVTRVGDGYTLWIEGQSVSVRIGP